jgi:1-acyl-sn-glycerol-3-phosphate acyltransferase
LYFLARDSLLANKLFALLLTSLNTIPVKPGKADVSAMKKVIRQLKAGWGVCLYPEGTRTYDGRIEPFKPGFGLLCRRGEATVVPMMIDGAFECWPRYRKIFSRGPITIYYGKAITAEQVKEMGDEKLAEAVTETLRRMQTDSRVKQGKAAYTH